MTADAGIPAYEISNYARLGEQSRHNLTYWRYQDYCGIGPGAHGRRMGMATVRHRKHENWLEALGQFGNGISETRRLDPREQASEAMLMRSEEHTSELQSLMRISYDVFCLKKKTKIIPKN